MPSTIDNILPVNKQDKERLRNALFKIDNCIGYVSDSSEVELRDKLRKIQEIAENALKN